MLVLPLKLRPDACAQSFHFDLRLPATAAVPSHTRRSRDALNLNLSRQEIEMADQSNNRGNFTDQRGETGAALDGNGVARGGITSGAGRNGNNGGGDGIIREGGSVSGAVSRKTPRGFAAMDPQAKSAIAAKGGRAGHQK